MLQVAIPKEEVAIHVLEPSEKEVVIQIPKPAQKKVPVPKLVAKPEQVTYQDRWRHQNASETKKNHDISKFTKPKGSRNQNHRYQ